METWNGRDRPGLARAKGSDMTTVVRRTGNPLPGLLEWFELNRPSNLTDLTHYIPVESYTEGDTFVLRADLPGVDPDRDIEVSVAGDVLTIRAERHEEEHAGGHSEVRYGSFTRSVRLPQGSATDRVVARYDAGVLVVTVPTTAPATEPIKVDVRRTGGTRS